MEEIKRIQLRGISRNPSDRTTADGGCAESLNVYVDAGEIAPALRPDDISAELGISNSIHIARVFIHKTNSEENYIYAINYTSTVIAIGTFQNTEFDEIIVLEEGEELRDIASVGNTIVISTESRMLYLLFQGGKYNLLGDTIPRAFFGFVNVDQRPLITDVSEEEDTTVLGQSPWKVKTGELSTKDRAPLGIQTNEYRVLDESSVSLLSHIWNTYQEMIGHNLNMGCFNAPVMLRYAIKLYDGTYFHVSAPILLGGAFNNGAVSQEPLQIFHQSKAIGSDTVAYEHKYKISLCYPFKVGMYKMMSDTNLEYWKDIISSIDVFITPPINLFPNGQYSARYADYEGDSNGYTSKIILDPINSENEDNIEKNILFNGSFFKIKSFTLEEMLASNPENLMELSGDMRGESIATQESFADADISSEVVTDKMSVFNNSILSYGGKVILPSGLPSLNGQFAFVNAPDLYYSYAFRYYIKNNSPNDFIVYSRDRNNDIALSPNKGSSIIVSSGRPVIESVHCEPYTFLSYPDSRCYKVDVCQYNSDGEEMGVCTIEMNPHPTVSNCAYAWLGIGRSLSSLSYVSNNGKFEDVQEYKIEDIGNKLLVSNTNNPFSFPSVNILSFQSDVIGTAVASVALSQGQYGQYPLYVFTKDGIWAIETASDGRFVTSKPLSREVCSNPDSITPIDQSVLFVTDKGLMMLHGADISDLSSNMTGMHYVINSSAKTIIDNQPGYEDFMDSLSDTTPFVRFLQESSIAYDYSGKRIICFNTEKNYQYVYKFDSNTWHKIGYDLNGLKPINSYPKCLALSVDDNRYMYFAKTLAKANAQELHESLLPYMPELTLTEVFRYLNMSGGIDVTDLIEEHKYSVYMYLNEFGTMPEGAYYSFSRVQDLTTYLDSADKSHSVKGVIVSRPFDMDKPDVLKTISDVRVRGNFANGAVKFILQGSQDGINYYTISTLRGKAWKMFRLILLSDLDIHERISWVDVKYQTKFTNKLR